MIRATFWFHPALLWLIGRMRLAREQVVDFEVVMLTSARKTYLKALLEFTIGRSCATVVPAPLFLAERQARRAHCSHAQGNSHVQDKTDTFTDRNRVQHCHCRHTRGVDLSTQACTTGRTA